ncbi:MAG: hypothetical protein M5T61_10000 [Acidimicrobiia bacterium]|nr:hypothetical protein [Acidimicrobiia bacterium]
MADPPAAVAGRGEDEGDRPLTVGRVLDDIGDDRIDERLWQLPLGSLGRSGLGPEARPHRTPGSGRGARRTGCG